MTDGLSRFTSDRRVHEDASWATQDDWESGVAENIDVTASGLVAQPSAQSSEIPGSETLYARYDFSKEDGTLPVTDQTGNGRDLDTGSYSGVSDDINGIQAGEFDGVSDYLRVDWSTLSPPYCMYYVHRLDNNDRHVLSFAGQNSEIHEARLNDSRGWRWQRFDGNNDDLNSDDTTQRYQLTSWIGAGDTRFRADGSEIASTTARTASEYTSFELGSLNNGGQLFWDGAFGEVLIYSTEHDDATIAEVESYLADKWNVSI